MFKIRGEYIVLTDLTLHNFPITLPGIQTYDHDISL